MNHTKLNAQFAMSKCKKSISLIRSYLSQKAFTAQTTKRHTALSRTYANGFDSLGTLTGLEQPNCSTRTRKGIVRVVAIVLGISLFLPMGHAIPAQLDPKQSAKAFAKSQIPSNKQWLCLNRLYSKESAWNPKARNGSHYGIPQGRSIYLKTATAHQQVIWGLRYISHRYQTPCQAWKHFKQRNWH